MRYSITDLDDYQSSVEAFETYPRLDASAHREIDRARREIELLAMVAAGPRQGIALLRRIGFTQDALANDDTRTIYTVLSKAGRPNDGLSPWSREQIAQECRRLLIEDNLWDESDLRRQVGSMRWGPGPLTLLLTACDYDADVLADIARELNAGSSRQGRAAA